MEPYVPELLTGGAVTFFGGADMGAAPHPGEIFVQPTAGSEQVTPEILDETFADFIPPSYPEEVELQTLIAVMECTSRELLPEPLPKHDPTGTHYPLRKNPSVALGQ